MVNKISFITKEFKILNKTIKVHFSENNSAEKYFNFSALDSEWHRKKIGEYHLTSLLACIRKYWYWFKHDRKNTLQEKGIFLIGKIFHKHIQDHLEKTLGFVIIECPCEDELEDGISIVFKIDIAHLRNKEISDIKTTRYMPILSDLSVKKFEEKFGKYILQVLVQIYFVNNTYFKLDPMKTIKLLYIDKADLYTKEIWMDYDKELAEYFYLKIRERAKYLHERLLTDVVPVHSDPDKNCVYCAFVDLCAEGSAIKLSLTVPVNFESNAYREKYAKMHQTKKAYWKYDPEGKFWIKTKGFLEFLKKELNYTTERISEIA